MVYIYIHTYIHCVPKLATPLQISWCKIDNTWQIFTKCETFMETIILKEELLPDMRDISEYCISFSRIVRPLIVRRKQLIFFQLKHQLSSRQHSGRLAVRIWIRLIIKSSRYFRSKCTRWRSTMLVSCASVTDCMGWTWPASPAYYWQGDQAVAHPPKSLRRGQRWPLWAPTSKTSSEWSSPWMFHIL